MHNYKELVQNIVDNGIISGDRTGTGTKSLFKYDLSFDLQAGFPLVTLKETWFKGICVELDWILKGMTNVKWLQQRGVHIWDKWADEFGNLGPTYGKQMRKWAKIEHVPYQCNWGWQPQIVGFVDPLAEVIEEIKINPDSRRLQLTLWNHSEIHETNMPPCTGSVIQFYVRNYKLSCFMHQRSCDVFLGLPFDIASFAILTHTIAKMCDLEVGMYHHSIGDAHIYLNHLDQVNEMLAREPYQLSNITVPRYDNIDDFNWEDIKLSNYYHHPAIKAPISV